MTPGPAQEPPHPRRGVVLIGLRRSGKTSVGALLARRLGREFLDTDAWCEQETGLSVAALITTRGEPYFRKMERLAVASVSIRGGAVVATGGGTPVNENCGEILSGFGTVIYLNVSPEVLFERALRDPHPEERPLLDGRDAAEEIAILHAKRDPSFRRLAHHVIDAEGSVEEVLERCEQILAR